LIQRRNSDVSITSPINVPTTLPIQRGFNVFFSNSLPSTLPLKVGPLKAS